MRIAANKRQRPNQPIAVGAPKLIMPTAQLEERERELRALKVTLAEQTQEHFRATHQLNELLKAATTENALLLAQLRKKETRLAEAEARCIQAQVQGHSCTLAMAVRAAEYKLACSYEQECTARLAVKVRDLFDTFVKRRCYEPFCDKDGVFRLHGPIVAGAPGHYACEEHAPQLLVRKTEAKFPCPTCRHEIPTVLALDLPVRRLENYTLAEDAIEEPEDLSDIDLKKLAKLVGKQLASSMDVTRANRLAFRVDDMCTATSHGCFDVLNAMLAADYQDTEGVRVRYDLGTGQYKVGTSPQPVAAPPASPDYSPTSPSYEPEPEPAVDVVPTSPSYTYDPGLSMSPSYDPDPNFVPGPVPAVL